jgi:dipeptidyl aminopeptidase/acylaminoacyl peptidase
MKFINNRLGHSLLTLMIVSLGLSALGQKKDGETEDQYRMRMEQERAKRTKEQQIKQFVSLEDFFKNPEISNYLISPDGQKFACLKPKNGRKNVVIFQEEGKKEIYLTNETERDLNNLYWANNEVLLFTKDNGGDENDVLYSVNANTSKLTTLTPSSNVKASMLDPLRNDPDHILVETNERNKEVFDVYKVNIYNGKKVLVAQNPGQVNSWLVDQEGRVMLATATDGLTTEILSRDSEANQDWKSIKKFNYTDEIVPLQFLEGGKSIYCLSNEGRNTTSLITMNRYTGEQETILYENEKYDLSRISYSKSNNVLEFVEYNSEYRERKFFDTDAEALFGKIGNAIGSEYFNVVSRSHDENKLIVRTYSDIDLGAYFIYDAATGSARKISDLAPWMKPELLCAMKPFSFQARDGFVIQGYLTIPKNSNGKSVPLVVNPHGGPWARDEWGYNPEVQFLANRGYAVVQINFRGSTGYGKKFWMAGFKQWGQEMQNDITDGVKYLIENGTADPSRIAIYGASYGGYATLAGLTFTPEIYACGIDYVGVSNLFTFMKSIPPYWAPYLEMMYEMVGNPDKDAEMMTKASPVFHVDKMKAPLLIAQGAKDPRVNINESDQMVEAIKKNGGKVEYIVEPEEGHGFSNEEARFNFYRKMEAFLARNMVGTK